MQSLKNKNVWVRLLLVCSGVDRGYCTPPPPPFSYESVLLEYAPDKLLSYLYFSLYLIGAVNRFVGFELHFKKKVQVQHKLEYCIPHTHTHIWTSSRTFECPHYLKAYTRILHSLCPTQQLCFWKVFTNYTVQILNHTLMMVWQVGQWEILDWKINTCFKVSYSKRTKPLSLICCSVATGLSRVLSSWRHFAFYPEGFIGSDRLAGKTDLSILWSHWVVSAWWSPVVPPGCPVYHGDDLRHDRKTASLVIKELHVRWVIDYAWASWTEGVMSSVQLPLNSNFGITMICMTENLHRRLTIMFSMLLFSRSIILICLCNLLYVSLVATAAGNTLKDFSGIKLVCALLFKVSAIKWDAHIKTVGDSLGTLQIHHLQLLDEGSDGRWVWHGAMIKYLLVKYFLHFSKY